MQRSPTATAVLLVWAALCFPAAVAGQAAAVPSIRRVQVLHTPNQVEIEIEATDRVVPQTNVLTNPDRLVVDFVNAVPGSLLRNQAVNRGEVKSLRVGLFSANPPVTRVVLDLNGPQPYQVFPAGRMVIVKVGGAGAETAGFRPGSGSALVNTSYPLNAVPISASARPPLEVSFQGGLLRISSDKASLSEVLFAVHQRTGADIPIPAGAEQEKVMADLGPAPAAEVLAHLLNGTKFNFLILSSSSDPLVLDRVILTPRSEGLMPLPLPQARVQTDDDADSEPSAAAPPPVISNPTPPVPPEAKPPQGNDPPE